MRLQSGMVAVHGGLLYDMFSNRGMEVQPTLHGSSASTPGFGPTPPKRLRELCFNAYAGIRRGDAAKLQDAVKCNPAHVQAGRRRNQEIILFCELLQTAMASFRQGARPRTSVISIN